MLIQADEATRDKRALLVHPETKTRQQIHDRLAEFGFAVQSCATLAEGKASFQAQPLVIATTEWDGSIPEDLIVWIRKQPVTAAHRPYILAIGDEAASEKVPPQNRQWDALLPAPVNPGQLKNRLGALERILQERNGAAPKDATPSLSGTNILAFSAKNADKALSPTEQFQALIDASPLAMAVFDKDLHFLAVNDRWQRDFRLNHLPVTGRRLSDIFPELGARWEESLDHALAGYSEQCGEARWIRADDTPFRVRWEIQPWVQSHGEVSGITVTCEVLQNQDEGSDSGDLEQVGRALLKGNFTPAIRVDLRGQIEFANEAAADLVGGIPPGRTFWEVFTTDKRRSTFKIEFLAAAKDTREQERFAFPPSFVERFPLGTRVLQVAWALTPARNPMGQINGLFCVGVLLPEALGVTLPDALPGGGLSLESVIEHVPFGLIVLDEERNTVFANHEHITLLGHDVRDHTDIEQWLEVVAPSPEIAPELLGKWRESVWRMQTSGTFTLRTRDQSLREIEFRPRPTEEGGMILTLADVTARRREEEARRASEAKFRAFYRNVGIGIALEDPAGTLFDVNPVFEALTGATRAEVRRTGMVDWVHPEDWPAVEASLAEAQSDAPASRDQAGVKARVGRGVTQDRWVRISVSHVADHTDRLVFAAYVVTPLDEQPVVETVVEPKDFREPAPPHAELLEAMPDLVAMVDGEGRVLDLIPPVSASLVADPGSASGQLLDDLIPEFHGCALELVAQTLDSNAVSLHDLSQDFGEGFKRHFEARFVAAGDGRCMVVIQDISFLIEWRRSLVWHSLAFEHSCNGIVIATAAGEITDWNPAAAKLFGYAKEEVVGRSLAMIFAPEDPSGFNRMVAGSLARGGTWSGAPPFYRRDGTVARCEVYYVAVPNEEDHSTLLIGINRPIPQGRPANTP